MMQKLDNKINGQWFVYKLFFFSDIIEANIHPQLSLRCDALG